MIDLIIPHYNNQEGLLRTLASVDTTVFKPLVVDDKSDEVPWVPDSVKLCLRPVNCGPGIQRQWGLDATNEPYVMFMDAGDEFLSKELQQEIAKTVEENPNIDMFLWPYYYEDIVVPTLDNRLHGNVYKREFLTKYGITFCPESSYMNEDIGFSRTCKAIHFAEKRDFFNGETPVMKWVKDENSLTQKNDRENFYRNQTMALARTSIHTINILRKNGINEESEMNYIAVALYFWFLRIAVERPQFKQEAWDGVRLYYTQYKDLIDLDSFTIANPYVHLALKFRNQVNFPINPIRFFREVTNNETVSELYGGKKNEEDLH